MRIACFAAVSIIALTANGAATAQTQPARQPTYPAPYPQNAYPQPTPYAAQPMSDADLLASEIRLLAADPNNVQALVRSGELALKLDDDTAAAAFFARASRIDPRNARVKAGEGSLLVSGERPGEALRYFAEAAALGGDVRTFAAERALAYDLIGEQERAQRDYRLALRTVDDDETRRRYALSLGISGKRELALKEIEPLLRKSDRGAWRSRAFILAMGGDRPGAERIATTMMPAGMAQGLQPFFEVLPTLRPADRAFAVHFGEVRASPTRIADARMTPALGPLGPDAFAPVDPAAKARPVAVAVAAPSRKDRRSRKQIARDPIVAATTPPVVPLPAPPAYVARPTALAATTPYRGQPYLGSRRRAPSGTRAANLAAANAMHSAAAIAAFANGPVPSQPIRTQPGVPVVSSSVALGSSTLVVPYRAVTPAYSAPVTRAQPPVALASSAPPPARSIAQPAPVPVQTVPSRVAQTYAPPAGYASTTATPVATTPPYAVAATAPSPVANAYPNASGNVAVAPQAAPIGATPMPVRSEQSILAAIIADINVPGTELNGPSARMAVTMPPPIRHAVPSRPLADRSMIAAQRIQPHVLADRTATRADDGEKETVRKPATDKKLTDRKKATRATLEDEAADDTETAAKKSTRKSVTDKTSATKKALADDTDQTDRPAKGSKAAKKVADAKKLADAKRGEDKRKNDPKVLEPQRYWVQVASGANENDLSKQWTKLKTKNAKALGGRTGWTQQQRATNRILTGPFKTDDEAQTFVNTLARQGVSGFLVASEAGQKVTKLPAK